MNNSTSEDYDCIIDDILLSEKRIAEKTYLQGLKKSSENSSLQGFQIGYQKGCDIGLEIGFYAGILTGIQKLQILKIVLLSEREFLILQKLLDLIKAFPQINDKNVCIIDKHNEIKGLYKKFCFNLKIRDLDKSVLNYSKWNS